MDINEGLERWRRTPLAPLVDVRDPDEYRKHRIPGSRNVPLTDILTNAENIFHDKTNRIFLFSGLGRRSAIAAKHLSGLGYRVMDLGGLINYRGILR